MFLIHCSWQRWARNGAEKWLPVSEHFFVSGSRQRCFAGPGRSGIIIFPEFKRLIWKTGRVFGGTRLPFYPQDAGRKIGFGTRPETSLVPVPFGSQIRIRLGFPLLSVRKLWSISGPDSFRPWSSFWLSVPVPYVPQWDNIFCSRFLRPIKRYNLRPRSLRDNWK